jgi:hypothetical protein
MVSGDYYNAKVFSEDQLADLLKLIPDKIQQSADITEALQAWAYFSINHTDRVKYNADVRDELSAIKGLINKLRKKIINLSEDASIQLQSHLGSCGVVEQLPNLEAAIQSATKSPVVRGRPKSSHYRQTLKELMLVWRWANKGNGFGFKFLDFAEVPMSIAFGFKDEAQPIEELMREIRLYLNKHPNGQTLHYLPHKTGQKAK